MGIVCNLAGAKSGIHTAMMGVQNNDSHDLTQPKISVKWRTTSPKQEAQDC